MISIASNSSGIEPHLHSRWFDPTPATMNVNLEHAIILSTRWFGSDPDLGIRCCSATHHETVYSLLPTNARKNPLTTRPARQDFLKFTNENYAAIAAYLNMTMDRSGEST